MLSGAFFIVTSPNGQASPFRPQKVQWVGLPVHELQARTGIRGLSKLNGNEEASTLQARTGIAG